MGSGRAWDRKLDPFLRRVALGVERRQGVFTDRLPAGSPEAMSRLPRFIRARRGGSTGHGAQAERTATGPLLYVNARVAPGAATGGLVASGAEVRGRAGDIVSLAVPPSALEDLASRTEVLWLRAAHTFSLQNEISMTDAHTGARSLQSTFGTTGSGVIVAVVDSGIDYTNDDLRNPDGTTRVLGIWDQTITDAAYPPPPGFTFGSYYTQADIDASLVAGVDLPTFDGLGHATHVSGTAAGNGLDVGNETLGPGTFAGMAPTADLLVVRVFDNNGVYCDECDLVAAVQWVDAFAKAAGKPWVGNMSLGDDTGGAHDGTSAEELAIDAFVGPGRPGAQLAVAAGNSGRTTRHFHWSGTLAAGQTFTNTFPLSTFAMGGTDNDIVFIDLWYEGQDSATVEVVTPGAVTVSAAMGADSGVVCTPSGAVQIDATNAGDPENGDNQVMIQIDDSSACTPSPAPASGTWTIRLITNSVGPAGGGRFDAWNFSTEQSGWVDFATFDLATSVSVPGTGHNAVTAGAYVSKISWTNGCAPPTTSNFNGTQGVGSLAPFSGIGPTRDGRVKPDIAAPGLVIGSTKARGLVITCSNLERDQAHRVSSGTSMATPHVAGAMALLFSLDPTLDGMQVRAALQRSALVDAQTGAVPNNRFGWGKLKAIGAAYDTAAMANDVMVGNPHDFVWAAQPTVTSWNVYRAPLPGLSANDYGACFLQGLTSPNFSDPDLPASGQGFVYFVTGRYVSPVTGLAVEGILGTDSTGRVRPNNSPCP